MALFLPEVAGDGTAALPPVPPRPTPPPAPGGWPGNAGSGGWPGPDTTGPGNTGPGRRRRSRRPLWVGAGVLTALVLIGSTVGGNRDGEVPTVAASAPSTTQTGAPATTRATPTPAPTTAPVVVEEVDEIDAPAVVRPAEVTRAPARTTEQRSAPAPETRTEPEPVPDPAPAPAPAEAYYANCDAVRAAGAAPIRVGQPGYREGLDRDGDGQGCGED
ncbi:excalibur calcium-binding domain-containing protein [Pseudonocardia abyssalis]|uniref:Excalibur calcium-binding domain-containing protein n=2 Tax=Pseudonocardia abyssalis TaxID=2792008 RepID=A0ABS6UW99_9PSEU|nr:excalibur calcium-binding domain-containing protein [Pseudonocardia abyssalis]